MAPAPLAPPAEKPEPKDLLPGKSIGLIPFLPAKESPRQYEWPSNQLLTRPSSRASPPAARRGNIIWVHVHNCAGTYICGIAALQEYVSVKNCNWLGDGVSGQGWKKPYAHLARCQERAESTKVTFSMIERGLEAGDLGCDGTLTGIMLRDPFHVARSTVMYNKFQEAERSLYFQAIEQKKELGRHGRGHKGLPYWDSYQHFDNFAVRTLSGHYNATPGSLTAQHLEQAKEVLRRIDVVMVVEHMSEHWPQLEAVFHWKPDISGHVDRNSHSSAQKKEAISAEHELQFKRLNALDYELLEFGKGLAAERTKAAVSKLSLRPTKQGAGHGAPAGGPQGRGNAQRPRQPDSNSVRQPNGKGSASKGQTRKRPENEPVEELEADEDPAAWRELGLIAFRPANETLRNWSWPEKLMSRGGMRHPKRSNIVWVHLHNFAGTYMCEYAATCEKITIKNCNWPGDGVSGLGWGEPYAHKARCVERAHSSQITFSMIERGLEAGDLGCQDLLSGIMMRDPFHGARSTILYNKFQEVEKTIILDAIGNKTRLRKRSSHRGLPSWDIHQHFDNFAVRTLSGHYMVPPGYVTREHLEQAKEVLKRLDVVIVLENLTAHWPQLVAVFQWRNRSPSGTRNGHTSAEKNNVFTAEEEVRFKRLNALDYELYEFGQGVAAERTRAAQARLAGNSTAAPARLPSLR